MCLVWRQGTQRGGVGQSLLSGSRGWLARLAREVGTPLYVYDAGDMRSRYRELTLALGSTAHRIFYSVKANSNLAILGVFRSLGAGADIVSGGELVRALRAGFAPGDLVFSGVGKTTAELAAALRQGVGLINVESFDELRRLRRITRELGVIGRFGIRVNPDITTDTHPYTQTGRKDGKFGVPLDEVVTLAQWAAQDPALELESVGMHIGSQICDARQFEEGAQRLVQLVSQLRASGVKTLRSIDVGGGLGIRYTSECSLSAQAFAEAVRPAADATGLRLLLEPGRFLVGNAGLLLTQCLLRKRSGGTDFVVVDAGMNDLVRPSLYGAEHEIRVVQAGADGASGAEEVDIVGPICETGDFLGRHRRLAGAQAGALLAIMDVGAYGFTMSSTYNSRPRPAEVLVDGHRWAAVRERETVDDLMRGERTLQEVDDSGWEAIAGDD